MARTAPLLYALSDIRLLSPCFRLNRAISPLIGHGCEWWVEVLIRLLFPPRNRGVGPRGLLSRRLVEKWGLGLTLTVMRTLLSWVSVAKLCPSSPLESVELGLESIFEGGLMVIID